MIPRFHELGEDQFEDLCREIFQEEPDVETVERYGTRKGQRQLGIDLLIEFKDKSLAAGQCKSHQRCDERLIRTACEEFLEHADHWRREGVRAFILFIAADTRRTQLHDERLRQRARLREQGFSLTVWSGAVFKARLRKHRQLVRHFLPYLEDYICGPSGQLDVQLSLQHETIQALAKQLGETAEGDHDEVRKLWQDGHAERALLKLRATRTERVTWSVLPAETRAKFLRLEGRLVLTSGDLATAKRLAAEAHDLDGSSGGRLAAMIAQAEGRLEDAVDLLLNDPDPDSQALKAAVQIQAGRIDEALDTLTGLPEHPDAHRLRSLIYLVRGEPMQAKAEAEKALALAPSWYWMRRTAATMRYLAGVSPIAVPNRFPDWPEPVNPSLIRLDYESVAARRSAAVEFEQLASQDSNTPLMNSLVSTRGALHALPTIPTLGMRLQTSRAAFSKRIRATTERCCGFLVGTLTSVRTPAFRHSGSD
jgi:tetratricopeptide (TPR) repeat protein